MKVDNSWCQHAVPNSLGVEPTSKIMGSMAGLYFNQLICKDIMDSRRGTKKNMYIYIYLWSYQSIWGLQTWCQLLILKNNYNCTCIERMRFQNSPKLNKPQNTFRNHLTPQNKVLVLIHVITGGIPEYQNFRTPRIWQPSLPQFSTHEGSRKPR